MDPVQESGPIAGPPPKVFQEVLQTIESDFQKVSEQLSKLHLYLYSRTAAQQDIPKKHKEWGNQLTALSGTINATQTKLRRLIEQTPYITDASIRLDGWQKVPELELRLHLASHLNTDLKLLCDSPEHRTALKLCKKTMLRVAELVDHTKLADIKQEVEKEIASQKEKIQHLKDKTISKAIDSLHTEITTLFEKISLNTVQMPTYTLDHRLQHTPLKNQHSFRQGAYFTSFWYSDILPTIQAMQSIAKSLQVHEDRLLHEFKTLFQTSSASLVSTFSLMQCETTLVEVKEELYTSKKFKQAKDGLHYWAYLFAWLQQLKQTEALLSELNKHHQRTLGIHLAITKFFAPNKDTLEKMTALFDVKSALEQKSDPPPPSFLTSWASIIQHVAANTYNYVGTPLLVLTREELDLEQFFFARKRIPHSRILISTYTPGILTPGTLKILIAKMIASCSNDSCLELHALLATLSTHYTDYFHAVRQLDPSFDQFITDYQRGSLIVSGGGREERAKCVSDILFARSKQQTGRTHSPSFFVDFLVYSECRERLSTLLSNKNNDQLLTSLEIQLQELEKKYPLITSTKQTEQYAILCKATWGKIDAEEASQLTSILQENIPSPYQFLAQELVLLQFSRKEKLMDHAKKLLQDLFLTYVNNPEKRAEWRLLHGVGFMERMLYRFHEMLEGKQKTLFGTNISSSTSILPLQLLDIYNRFKEIKSREEREEPLEEIKKVYLSAIQEELRTGIIAEMQYEYEYNIYEEVDS